MALLYLVWWLRRHHLRLEICQPAVAVLFSRQIIPERLPRGFMFS
jgi:hypothetical protein